MKPGSVPTARIGPIIAELIRERWPYGGGLEVLAEKVGCEQSSIMTIIEQQWEGVSFDLADQLLCALGRWDMWHGVLADVYPTKFMATCALHSCQKTFLEYQHTNGIRKRYCSEKCRTLAKLVRTGRAPGNRYLARNRCKAGHPLSVENTLTIKGRNGKTQRKCRTCSLAYRREWRKSEKVRARERERQRARRAAAHAT